MVVNGGSAEKKKKTTANSDLDITLESALNDKTGGKFRRSKNHRRSIS